MDQEKLDAMSMLEMYEYLKLNPPEGHKVVPFVLDAMIPRMIREIEELQTLKEASKRADRG